MTAVGGRRPLAGALSYNRHSQVCLAPDNGFAGGARGGSAESHSRGEATSHVG